MGRPDIINHLARLFAMRDYIARYDGQGLQAPQLAQRYGVTLRTIQRDLDLLQEAGVPLHYESRSKGWRICR